jgi:S1-C subfamily serine protease
LSLVIFTENGSVKTAGAAINITSDGLFLSVKPVLAAAKSHSLLVLLNDGRTFPVTEIFSDPATNLTMLKTSATSVPVSDIARSADLVPGQRILFLSASVLPYGSRFAASFVQFSQYDASGQILDSDRPSQSFGAQPINNTLPGQAVVNLEAGTVGIFDGTGVISSDILKPAVDLFVNQKSNLQRPSFGFHYRIINVTEADLLGTSQGAQVVKPADNQPAVLPASSAATAGLVEGDVVTAVDNVKIESNRPLAEILQKYKPGDTLKLAIVRNKIPMNLTLVAGTLK